MPSGPPVRPSALAEGIFRREILPWGLLGLALGLVEGATAAILVKQHFAGVAPVFVVNLAVGLVSGAPAFSNVLSFVWANIAHGRARVRLMVGLQAAFALLVGCVSFASHAAGGLILTVVSVIAARVLWGGILTVRAAIWTANYPRNVLARITGRIVIVNALTVAASAALVGWALEARFIDARWLYGAGALAPGPPRKSHGHNPKNRHPAENRHEYSNSTRPNDPSIGDSAYPATHRSANWKLEVRSWKLKTQNSKLTTVRTAKTWAGRPFPHRSGTATRRL